MIGRSYTNATTRTPHELVLYPPLFLSNMNGQNITILNKQLSGDQFLAWVVVVMKLYFGRVAPMARDYEALCSKQYIHTGWEGGTKLRIMGRKDGRR